MSGSSVKRFRKELKRISKPVVQKKVAEEVADIVAGFKKSEKRLVKRAAIAWMVAGLAITGWLVTLLLWLGSGSV